METVALESTDVTDRWGDADMSESMMEMSEDAAEPSHPEGGPVAGEAQTEEVVAEVAPDGSYLSAVADGTKEMATKGELLASAQMKTAHPPHQTGDETTKKYRMNGPSTRNEFHTRNAHRRRNCTVLENKT